LGLSSLLPMSPIMGMALPAKTPAATPLGGVAVGAASKVYDALNAAMQVGGGWAEEWGAGYMGQQVLLPLDLA
jgi:hypothetical protein